MRRQLLTLVITLTLALSAFGDTEPRPFKGSFVNDEHRVNLVLDLYEASLFAPNYGYLGELNGYMNGRGIYGMWFLVDCKIEDKKATLRMTNDIGSDSQTVIFEQLNDSIFTYKAVDGNEVKKAVGRRLVRIPSHMKFKKVSPF